MLPFRTILCPLDFSQPSYKALDVGIDIASQFGAELVLVNVVRLAAPGVPADPTFAFTGPDNYDKAVKQNAEEQLSFAAQRIPPELKPTTLVGDGDPAEEITRTAHDQNADLIVIATHGLTGWRHLVFGSVAEKVIRLADRPVLVIPVHEKRTHQE